jgi:hypothetical protein
MRLRHRDAWSVRAERRRRARVRAGRAASVAGSLALHALLLLLLDLWPDPPPPPPEVIELSLVRPGDGDEEGVPATTKPSPEPPAPPTPPTPPKPRPEASPPPAPALPPSPAPSTVPLPQPPSPSPRPRSFREWQQSRASAFLPTAEPVADGGAHGTDLIQRRGRDRCEPQPYRRFDVLFLLFDASGSMSDMGRAQALSCAHQYARAALERGAPVIVGTFARDAVFAPPTRRLLDVQAALRSAIDASATVLPTRQLGPLLDAAPGATAELVVVSDGWFVADDEVLVWYRYFLEANRDNRATMYTVGAPGQRDAVRRLQGIGFDVFIYDQLR